MKEKSFYLKLSLAALAGTFLALFVFDILFTKAQNLPNINAVIEEIGNASSTPGIIYKITDPDISGPTTCYLKIGTAMTCLR